MWNLDFSQHTKRLSYSVCVSLYELDNECHQYSPQNGLGKVKISLNTERH